jgi:hypothetical protein
LPISCEEGQICTVNGRTYVRRSMKFIFDPVLDYIQLSLATFPCASPSLSLATFPCASPSLSLATFPRASPSFVCACFRSY